MQLSLFVEKYLKTTPRQALEFLLCVLTLLLSDPTAHSLAVGLSLSVVGMVLRIFATGYRYSESVFMVRGPYRFVRHPHYLGTILVATGMCVAGRNAAAAVITFLVLAYVYQSLVKAEERRLMQSWGPRYRIFKANVSAIIPQIIPVVPAGGQGIVFSFKKSLLKGRVRELNAFFAISLVFSLLYWSGVAQSPRGFYLVVGFVSAAVFVFRFVFYRFFDQGKRSRGLTSSFDL
jgi:protein-S-isoprenylcysteine O-methyltransferase Ste14